MIYTYILLLLLLSSCADNPYSSKPPRGDFITRKHNEYSYIVTTPEPQPPPTYPWEKPLIGNHPPISKEHFRCKGSSLNPPKYSHENNENICLYDCGGSEKHSLPLRNSKEFVYPILIELLNYIQAQTGKRVVITCGHRCPDHNIYSDSSKENQYSKHMIGAEVSFYVQGLENQPEKIISLLQQKYKIPFERYTKTDTNVSTQPWFNKEIFIKLFKKDEGRNFDNRHPYPYISIQVRFDNNSQSKVIYDWNSANKNYLRK